MRAIQVLFQNNLFKTGLGSSQNLSFYSIPKLSLNVKRIRLNFRVFLFCLGFLLQFFPDPGGFRFCFFPGSFSGDSILFEPCQFIFGF